MYKSGTYIYRMPRVTKMFPDAKFVHIYRDPRGVYNSQRYSRQSSTGDPFTENPVRFARKWGRLMRISESWESDPRFIAVSYEDLVTDTDEVMGGICEFLGAGRELSEDRDYFARIPDAQKHLHRLVKKSPRRDRISAWQNSLSDTEIWIIERYAKKHLCSRGYESVGIRPGLSVYREYLGLLVSYYLSLVRGLFQSLKNLYLFRTKVKARLSSWHA
jgi:hypothetical protein